MALVELESRIARALRELLELKDGPRDAVYEVSKRRAWTEARAALFEYRCVFPSVAGDVSTEYGRKTAHSEKIYPVADTETGRQDATHTRTVVSWWGEGPNDNWPKYTGPWKVIGGPWS